MLEVLHLVEKLSFTMVKHLRSYKLQWLNECVEVGINKQVLVGFRIGEYSDEVTCDMVPMHAMCDLVPMHSGHILLEGSMIGK